MADEITAVCNRHGAMATELTDDKTTGLLASIVTLHQQAYPGCEITYRRESVEDAERRREREEHEASDEVKATAREMMDASRRRLAERGALEALEKRVRTRRRR